MIAIVDYGSGNIRAIANVFKRLDIPTFVASVPEDLARATRIILPGVGAFDEAMGHLNASGMRDALTDYTINRHVNLLGICVGMQLLAHGSEEGALSGLGWIDADVKMLDRTRLQGPTQLPHMGWNDVHIARRHPLFAGLEEDAVFYFLHTYYFSCRQPQDELAYADYGGRFTCAVNAGNVFGVQFHPEKSHQAGIQLLKNFASL